MTSKPTAWENISLSEYPGADGKPKYPKPGDVITEAAQGWPPKWVVDAGYVKPAKSKED